MVTAPNDDWTEDLCIALIREYRKRPILWDPKDPFFFKKTMKPEAWEGIAAAIGMPADVCKHKMVILQSSFRREKSKIMQSIKTSPENTKYTSSWFAFEDMAFLIDKDTERKRQTTGDDTSVEEPSIKRSLIEHYNEKHKASTDGKKKLKMSKIGTVLPNVSPQSNPSPSRSRIVEEPATTSVTIAPFGVPPLVPIPTRHKEETLEEIKSFTNFIAFKMKKYSETTKNCVQQAICDIIFKADQNFYEGAELGNGFVNYHPTVELDGHAMETRDEIDLGNGQTIKLQLDDSD